LSAAEFAPAWWLRGPHAQTVVPSLLPARAVRGVIEALDVLVAPGSAVRVLVSRPAARARGTVVVIHGLGGSAESGYMRRTAAAAVARRFVVARMNLRNCGGTEALASTLYNAGQSGDAHAVLAAVEAHGLPRPIFLAGFSLGGNLAMRYAGLSGAVCRADAVAGINPPVDLAACVDAIERPGNALYQSYFTRALCSQLRGIRRVRSVAGPDASPRAIGGIRRFDEWFTAPDAGYHGAAEYYRAASAGPHLSGIRRPALVLASEDDPFVPIAMFAPHRADAETLAFAHPRHGGHCGYWGAGRPRFWAAEAVLDFFESSASAA
jgi:predicted alpha/beta-fold hydrolase